MSALTDEDLEAPQFKKLWDFYGQDRKYKEVQCRKCKKIIQLRAPVQITIGSMRRHLRIKHKIILDDFSKIKQQPLRKAPTANKNLEPKKKEKTKGFEYNWLNYFTESVPSDEGELDGQDQTFEGTKDFYHGTYFTDPLKYLSYKKYSVSDMELIQKEFDKEFNLSKDRCQKTNILPTLMRKITAEKNSEFLQKFDIFNPVQYKVRQSFQDLEQYKLLSEFNENIEIWQKMHETLIQYLSKHKKNKFTSLLSNFKSDEQFKQLCNCGYTIYLTHDIRNNFLGFENRVMKKNYQKYGEVIFIITILEKALNICIFASQNQSANLCILGVCVFEVYDSSISKRIFDFFMVICKQCVPLCIYMDQKSILYQQNFVQYFTDNYFLVKIIEMGQDQHNIIQKLKYKKFVDHKKVFVGYYDAHILEQPLIQYFKWAIIRIKKHKISLKSLFLMLPQIQNLSNMIQNRKQAQFPIEYPKKLTTLMNQEQFEAIISPKLQHRILKQFQNCEKLKNYRLVMKQVVEMKQIKTIQGYKSVQMKYTLYYNNPEKRWICNCQKLTITGIPCCHLMKILGILGGSLAYYLNSRWINQ